MGPLLIILFSTYLLTLIIMAIKTGKSPFHKDSGSLITAFTTSVTARGTWLLLGISSYAYNFSGGAIWLVISFIVTETFFYLFLAPRISGLLPAGEKRSFGSILYIRFPEAGKPVLFMTVIVLLFYLVLFVSGQFKSGGQAMYAFLGVSFENGIIFTGVFLLVFLFLGNRSVLKLADFLNTILLLIVITGIPILLIIKKEGFSNLLQEVMLADPGMFRIGEHKEGVIAGLLFAGVGSLGNPQLISQIPGGINPSAFRSMAGVNFITSLIISTGSVCTGIFARAYFPDPGLIPGADSLNVFFGISGVMYNQIILAIALVTVTALIISSAGSYFLIASESIMKDILVYIKWKSVELSVARKAFYSKISMVIFLYSGILLAYTFSMDFNRFFLYAWSGLGASFGPALLMVIFSKEVTKTGIMAGIGAGAITVILWESIPFLCYSIYSIIPGFIISIIAVFSGNHLESFLVFRRLSRKAYYSEINRDKKY